MNYKYPLATSSWDKHEYAALDRVISSDRFSMGEEVATFEARFAKYFGAKYAVMVNSGSSANLLIASALLYSSDPKKRLAAGSEIIVPAVSWSTTYSPLAQCGFVQKFVDIDLTTLNYDITALKDAISDQTRAIMVVNLLGNPNEFSEIVDIADRHNLLLIEDNCESMGATYSSKMTGTFGLMGSFSSYFSHHISTMEGGVVLTDDEELHHILLCLRSHGWTRQLPDDNRLTGAKSNDAMEESFNFVLPGYNVRPLEMSGALGVEQLKKLTGLLHGRRENGRKFTEMFSDSSIFSIQREIGQSSWFGFALILRDHVEMDRQTFAQKLEELGFECRPIVSGNFARKKVLQYMPHSIYGELANADYIDKKGLFIGNHHYDCGDAFEALRFLSI